MPDYDFAPLCEHYPEVIAQLPPVFTSHQFILELAHRQQQLYIEALYAHRNASIDGRASPFQFVHMRLVQLLTAFPNLVERTRSDVPSKDIFGQDSSCTEWRKLD